MSTGPPSQGDGHATSDPLSLVDTPSIAQANTPPLPPTLTDFDSNAVVSCQAVVLEPSVAPSLSAHAGNTVSTFASQAPIYPPVDLPSPTPPRRHYSSSPLTLPPGTACAGATPDPRIPTATPVFPPHSTSSPTSSLAVASSAEHTYKTLTFHSPHHTTSPLLYNVHNTTLSPLQDFYGTDDLVIASPYHPPSSTLPSDPNRPHTPISQCLSLEVLSSLCSQRQHIRDVTHRHLLLPATHSPLFSDLPQSFTPLLANQPPIDRHVTFTTSPTQEQSRGPTPRLADPPRTLTTSPLATNVRLSSPGPVFASPAALPRFSPPLASSPPFTYICETTKPNITASRDAHVLTASKPRSLHATRLLVVSPVAPDDDAADTIQLSAALGLRQQPPAVTAGRKSTPVHSSACSTTTLPGPGASSSSSSSSPSSSSSSSSYVNFEEDLYSDLDLDAIEASAIMAEPRLLDVFRGTPSENADEWLRNFHKYTIVKKFDSGQAAASASLFLRDSAKSWYNSLADDTTADLQHFTAAFTTRYVKPTHKNWQIETEIYDIQQKPSQSVHDFLTEMQYQAQRSGVGSDILLKLTVRGLRPNIRAQVLQHDDLTWETLAKWATMAEGTLPSATVSDNTDLSKILETMTSMKSSITNLEKNSKVAEVADVAYYTPPSQAYPPVFQDMTVEDVSAGPRCFTTWQPQQPQQRWGNGRQQFNNGQQRRFDQPSNQGSYNRGNYNRGYNNSYRGMNSNRSRPAYSNTTRQNWQNDGDSTQRYGNPPMQRYNNYNSQQPRNASPRGRGGPYRGSRGAYNGNQRNGYDASQPFQQLQFAQQQPARPNLPYVTYPSDSPRRVTLALSEHGDQRCTHCGGPSHPDLSQCPAQGQQCHNCQRYNHFAHVCRQGARRQLALTQ